MSNPTIPKLGTINLGQFDLDLDYYLSQPYDDISHAAVELPSLIEWVNAQLQYIVQQKIVKRQEVKTVRATAFIRMRNGEWEEHITSPNTRPTDKIFESLVERDSQVIETNEEYAVLLGWSSRLTNLLYVLQAKLDLTRSTESTRRMSLAVPVEVEES